jgi:hypothetical protein
LGDCSTHLRSLKEAQVAADIPTAGKASAADGFKPLGDDLDEEVSLCLSLAVFTVFSPVFSRFLRVFTVSPRRLEPSPKPQPRAEKPPATQGQEFRTPPFARHS